jgi:hypothetical protein
MRSTQFAFKFAEKFPKVVSTFNKIATSKTAVTIKNTVSTAKDLRANYKELVEAVEEFGYEQIAKGLPQIEGQELSRANRLALQIWKYGNKSYTEIINNSSDQTLKQYN